MEALGGAFTDALAGGQQLARGSFGVSD